eukprot:TRINITY_DN10089_c0_g1_i1.p1 TRINITY_DN10089_c0_g1~~TRINITY_DN10089_c0_g1_i1.p1  ORF type:complete len:149 (+),score=5.24 TRINITY_DN10089_c0_g1_i1:39-485(+)
MALWDQVTFDNLSSCPKFAPNRLKPDLCRDCMQRVTAHKQDAVTEEQLRLALDHLPNCKPASLIDLKDSAGGQLWLGSFKAVHPSFIEQHQIAMVVTAAKGGWLHSRLIMVCARCVSMRILQDNQLFQCCFSVRAYPACRHWLRLARL